MKRPWEMTRKEFYESFEIPKDWKQRGFKLVTKRKDGGPVYIEKMITPEGRTIYPVDRLGLLWMNAKYSDPHSLLVAVALCQGKPVPKYVLADYPKLQEDAKLLVTYLQDSIKEEQQAIKMYHKRAEWARKTFPPLADVWEHIQKEEEHHLKELQDLVNKIRP